MRGKVFFISFGSSAVSFGHPVLRGRLARVPSVAEKKFDGQAGLDGCLTILWQYTTTSRGFLVLCFCERTDGVESRAMVCCLSVVRCIIVSVFGCCMTVEMSCLDLRSLWNRTIDDPACSVNS